ncbi:MAG: hypothetical protein AAF628_05640 [Planctomycetota bacterium]
MIHASDPLAGPLATFSRHQGDLLEAGHAGKWALVYGDTVHGVFESRHGGLADGYRRFGNVPFLVREVQAQARPSPTRWFADS